LLYIISVNVIAVMVETNYVCHFCEAFD